MANFLFWNTAKKDLTMEVARLVQLHDVDMLILAESRGIPAVQLLEAVNAHPGVDIRFHHVVGQERIRIYSRFPDRAVTQVFDSGGISIRRIHLPGFEEFLLVAAHLPSKLRWQAGEQQDMCCRLREFIESAETSRGHQRTLVVGI